MFLCFVALQCAQNGERKVPVQKIYKGVLGFLVVLFLSGIYLQAYAQPTELSAVRLGQSPEQTRVVFEVKNNLDFKVFSLQNPARVVLDFEKATNSLSFQNKRFQDARIAGMRIATNKDRTRVVLDLRDDFAYKYFILQASDKRPRRLVLDLSNKTKTILAKQEAATKPVVKTQPQVQAPISKPEKPSVVLANKVEPSQNIVKANKATEEMLNKNQDFAPRKEFLVAIDPGHGGNDTGAVGPTGVKEKDITLALSRALKSQIDKVPGMRAILIRDKDVYLSLSKRVEIAEQHKADLFISVHADAYSTAAPRGGSVYVISQGKGASTPMAKILAMQENAAAGVLELSSIETDALNVIADMSREKNYEKSKVLGNRILQEMKKNMKMHKNGLQSANFAVLRQASMPSVLIEAAFISNPIEEKNLTTRAFQQRFAQTVAQGIGNYNEQVPSLTSNTMMVQYRIKRGDNLSSIADNYGTTQRELMRINKISNANKIMIGQRIRVPITENFTLAYQINYKVKPGDTLSQIAFRHKVSQQEIMRLNKITNARKIFVGQQIKIPVKEKLYALAS